jgi:uncharacterized protein DUF4160
VPVLLHLRGYEFYFRSSDGGEPPHVHVKGNGGRAKLWLSPRLRVVDDRGYDRRQLGEIERVTTAHREEWLTEWSRFFKR